MAISMKSIISAISLALDLADNNWNKLDSLIDHSSGINYCSHTFSNHCKRTSYISLELGRQLNLSKQAYYNLYITSLIHDIGTQNIFDLAHNSSVYMKKHCEEGYNMLKDIPSLSYAATIIKYHHENYNGTGCFNLSYLETPLESQIIRLADLIETQFDYDKHYYTNMNHITSWIKDKSKILFSEEIVNNFLVLAQRESFWLNLYNKEIMDDFIRTLAPEDDRFISLIEFEQIANIFATIIDNESKFTASHSKEIANLAYRISLYLNYTPEKALKMKISGLLHDVGKLAIPCEILDKEGRLTPEEFALIKSHVYYTYLILNKITDIDDICDWASNHHEKLNGTGYPKHIDAMSLSEESRIIAVCDIYQALIADRPYRNGLSKEAAFSIMDEMVENEFICIHALNALKVMILN